MTISELQTILDEQDARTEAAWVRPIDALRALFACFDEDGRLKIYPSGAQFRPVDDPRDAITVMEACRRVLGQQSEEDGA